MGLENMDEVTDAAGATVVITHRVGTGHQTAYETWLDEIGPICRQAPGHLDWQIIRPIPGVTGTYTVVIRFDTRHNLENWMNSDARRSLIEKVRPLLAKDDDFYIRSGVDFWFAPEGAQAKLPVRWKQFLVTWSVIFPLALVVPLLLLPALHRAGLPPNHYLDTLLVTGVVVALMVYLIMPHITKVLKRWLFD